MSNLTDTTYTQRYHHKFDHSKFDFQNSVPEYDIVSAFEIMGSRVNSLRNAPEVKLSIWTSLGKQTYEVIKSHCEKKNIYLAISDITLDPMYDEATDRLSVQSEIVYHKSGQDSLPSKYTKVTLGGQLSSVPTEWKLIDGPHP